MVNGISINQDLQIPTQVLKSENVQETISKSKQVVTDNFESNSAAKAVAGNASDPDVMRNTILLLPPLALANSFIETKIAGNETSSVLAKMANWGDKISGKLKLDKLLSKDTSKKVSDFFANNRFTKYFTKSYKAIPKSSFAKGSTLTDKFSQELIGALKSIDAESLTSSLSKETVDVLKNIATESTTSVKIPVKDLLGATDELISKGITTVEQGGLIPKKINISGIRNKLKAADLQMGKTGLGNIFSKGFLKAKDTVTFGGGLLGLAFTANSIIQAIKATKEAPKGEKRATFMHVLSEQYVGLLLFQPSVNLLYKLGGNKYRGMSVQGRNALKDLIQKTNADTTLTKEAYKIANLQKKLLLKGVDSSKVSELAGKSLGEAKTLFKSLKNSGAKLKFWEKPLKAAATVLDTGLDSIKNPSSLGKASGKLKGFMGGLGRFLFIFMVLQPLLQKPVTKLCHKIFGEPKAYLAKQKTSTENTNKNNENNLVGQDVSSPATGSETNLLKIFNKNAAPVQQSDVVASNANPSAMQPVSQLSNNEEIPALGIFNRDKSKKEETGYIPSIKVDNSHLLKREKEIEEQVDRFIAEKDKSLNQLKRA